MVRDNIGDPYVGPTLHATEVPSSCSCLFCNCVITGEDWTDSNGRFKDLLGIKTGNIGFNDTQTITVDCAVLTHTVTMHTPDIIEIDPPNNICP